MKLRPAPARPAGQTGWENAAERSPSVWRWTEVHPTNCPPKLWAPMARTSWNILPEKVAAAPVQERCAPAGARHDLQSKENDPSSWEQMPKRAN